MVYRDLRPQKRLERRMDVLFFPEHRRHKAWMGSLGEGLQKAARDNRRMFPPNLSKGAHGTFL